MKTVAALLVAGVMAFAPGGGAAETVEVPVPGLEGHYDPGAVSKSASFTVDFDPATIVAVKLNVRAVLSPTSKTSCGFFNGAVFDGTVRVSSGDFTTGDRYVEVFGFEFGYLWSLKPGEAASWAGLDEGTGEIELQVRPGTLPGGCAYLHDQWGPPAEVTYTALVFELSDEVSVEAQTWGWVKALYATGDPQR